MPKILPLLTARYIILGTHRLQPPRDDPSDRGQWFSSMKAGNDKMLVRVANGGESDQEAV